MTGASARPESSRVDAGGTVLRLRALHVMGYSAARIARAVGASERAIQRIVRGDVHTVTPALRGAVAGLYDRWWDKRAPERTRAERAGASAARRRAMRGGWCAGAAFDDDQLDHPGYQPSYGWRPARGTGTAGPAAANPRKEQHRMNPRHGRRSSPATLPHPASGTEDRLARIADLLGECPPPDLAGGCDQCAHGIWPCVITQAVWLAQGRDRGQEVHAACQAAVREAEIEEAGREAYEEWVAAEREGRPPYWETEAEPGTG